MLKLSCLLLAIVTMKNKEKTVIIHLGEFHVQHENLTTYVFKSIIADGFTPPNQPLEFFFVFDTSSKTTSNPYEQLLNVLAYQVSKLQRIAPTLVSLMA